MLIDAPKQMALSACCVKPNQRDNIRQAIKQITGKILSASDRTESRSTSRQEDDPLALLAKDAEAEGIEVVKK